MIETIHCLGDFLIGDGGEVAVLGKVLADEPVGVFV